MTAQILVDATARPELFFWNGPISELALSAWLSEHGLLVPPDLVAFLTSTGGGDAFESETFLGPYGRADLGDDFVGANQFLHSRGLPLTFVAFHHGLVVSAVEIGSGTYATFNDANLTPASRFSSFETWYAGTLRLWYSERYGLPSTAA